MIHPLLFHNGRIVDSTAAILRPGQLGLLAGWGIFTTIRIAGGVLFEFDRHWARMKRDAELMRIPFPADAAQFERSLLTLVDANKKTDATMRVVIVRNHGGLWEGPGIDRDFDVIAMTADIVKWASAQRLGVVPQARHAGNRFAGTKILSWAQNLTSYEQAHLDGFDEVVLLNERDEIAECTSANVFAVFADRVLTPPLSSGCLPGITRNLLLEEVRVQGITVEEHSLRLEDLERATQIFVTSTTRGLLPVTHVEGLSIRNEGDVCARLNAAFEAHVAKYVAAHKTPVHA